MGLYKQAGYDGYLPLPATPTPPLYRHIHDVPGTRDRAHLVLLTYHNTAVALDYRFPALGGGKGVTSEVWGSIRSISKGSSNARRESGVPFRGSLLPHRTIQVIRCTPGGANDVGSLRETNSILSVAPIRHLIGITIIIFDRTTPIPGSHKTERY
jgi:hypothetical protein